jgi:hypothetical protein
MIRLKVKSMTTQLHLSTFLPLTGLLAPALLLRA